MRIQLSAGEAHVRVAHVFTRTGRSRVTEVVVTLPSGECFRGAAQCTPPDNFNKWTGRKIAMERLMDKVRSVSREDRKKLWEIVLGR